MVSICVVMVDSDLRLLILTSSSGKQKESRLIPYVTPYYLAKASNARTEGSDSPHSHLDTALLVTPIKSASSCCVRTFFSQVHEAFCNFAYFHGPILGRGVDTRTMKMVYRQWNVRPWLRKTVKNPILSLTKYFQFYRETVLFGRAFLAEVDELPLAVHGYPVPFVQRMRGIGFGSPV